MKLRNYASVFKFILLIHSNQEKYNNKSKPAIESWMVRIIENYTLYEVVGEGAYGKVYRAVNKLDSK